MRRRPPVPAAASLPSRPPPGEPSPPPCPALPAGTVNTKMLLAGWGPIGMHIQASACGVPRCTALAGQQHACTHAARPGQMWVVGRCPPAGHRPADGSSMACPRLLPAAPRSTARHRRRAALPCCRCLLHRLRHWQQGWELRLPLPPLLLSGCKRRVHCGGKHTRMTAGPPPLAPPHPPSPTLHPPHTHSPSGRKRRVPRGNRPSPGRCEQRLLRRLPPGGRSNSQAK